MCLGGSTRLNASNSPSSGAQTQSAITSRMFILGARKLTILKRREVRRTPQTVERLRRTVGLGWRGCLLLFVF